jgi:hypothetical protein
MTRFVSVILAIFLLVSCARFSGSKQKNRILEKDMSVRVCGIGKNENLAAVDAVGMYSFARDGLDFRRENGDVSFRVDVSSVSASDSGVHEGKATNERLSDGRILYSFPFSGKLKRPAGSVPVQVRIALAGSDTEPLPVILRQAVCAEYPGNGVVEGRAYLSALSWTNGNGGPVFEATVDLVRENGRGR